MGQKTLAEFRDDIKFNLGQRTDIDTFTAAWVNSAYLDFTTRNRFWSLTLPKYFTFPELLTATAVPVPTVSGVPTIAVPTDCLFVRHVWNSTSDFKLDRIKFFEYVKDTGRGVATSAPRKWVRDGTKIYLYPTPDDAYNLYVYYRKRPALLVNPTDTTEIGAEWDDPIAILGTIYSFMRLKDFDKASTWKQEWLDMVAARIGIYDQEMRDMAETYLKPDWVYKQQFKY